MQASAGSSPCTRRSHPGATGLRACTQASSAASLPGSHPTSTQSYGISCCLSRVGACLFFCALGDVACLLAASTSAAAPMRMPCQPATTHIRMITAAEHSCSRSCVQLCACACRQAGQRERRPARLRVLATGARAEGPLLAVRRALRPPRQQGPDRPRPPRPGLQPRSVQRGRVGGHTWQLAGRSGRVARMTILLSQAVLLVCCPLPASLLVSLRQWTRSFKGGCLAQQAAEGSRQVEQPA